MRHKITPALVLASNPTIKSAFAAVNNRGPGFDTIRMVAASAVVLHHSLKVEIDIVRDDLIFRFSDGYTHLGLYAVSIFFALSGFLVTPGLAKNGNVLEYLSRRFMRIMPLLAFVVIVTAFLVGPLVTSLPPGEYFTSFQTWRYLQNITTALSLQLPGVVDYDGGNTINGPMWTLRFEWICYLAIAAASILAFFRHRVLFLAGYVAVLGVMVLGFDAIPADRVRGLPFVLLFLFSYFGAGVLIFLYSDVLRWSRGLMLLAFAALVASLYFGLGYILAPFLTAYLVVGLGLIRFPWSSLFEKADLSYGIYLTHSVILVVMMHIQPIQSGLVVFAICLPLSCLAALFTWNFIEKPALRHKSLPASLARKVLVRLPPPFAQLGQN